MPRLLSFAVCTFLLQSSVLLLVCPAASSQTSTNPPAATSSTSASQSAPEITAHDETATFKVKVNLVEVRVVVRDSKGQPIGNLKQEDFQLLDDGKPQTITKFSAETAPRPTATPAGATAASSLQGSYSAPTATVTVPDRFISYLFDDVHVKEPDLAQARNAVKQQFGLMGPNDRAAIFTTSGQTQLDFTDDRAKLTDAVDHITPHSLAKAAVTPCPNISYYQADLIQNKRDERALQIATEDALECAFLSDQQMYDQAKERAKATALEVLNQNDDETRLAFSVLKNVIRRTEAMPGERTIVLVSPGFLNPDELSQELELMDRAVHARVIINTMDVRGLYTDVPDISEERPPSPLTAGVVQQYNMLESQENAIILADFADATGGTFFHNNNDLKEGFRRLASPPEYSYILAFTPQNLKLDGKYHRLKIVLKPPSKGTIQARKGYYAPKGPSDASEQAKQDIEDAVFSREEVRDIPVEVHTQFFKADGNEARLSVVARLDVRHIHFRKTNGRNNNDLTVVSALFDNNGNFVTGTQKVLQLHLKDETLETRLGSGLILKSNFDVKPGSYVVRLVVRGEDGQLAAENSAVEIP